MAETLTQHKKSLFPGWIEGCSKDQQNITTDWLPLQQLIEGVKLREVKNVTRSKGCLTEILRTDWHLDNLPIDQVFQSVLNPGAVSAWHVHQYTTDRLFINFGQAQVVLYDGRENSPTYGRVNEFHFGITRPALLIVPPGVWHGVYNPCSEPSALLNLVDIAYDYEDPDHWRLPPDSDKIPFTFQPFKGA